MTTYLTISAIDYNSLGMTAKGTYSVFDSIFVTSAVVFIG